MALLSTPIIVHVVRALAEGPRALVELRRRAGLPPQTTMRGHIRALERMGVVARRRQAGFPGALDFELASPGRALVDVAESLGDWLSANPEGEIGLGTPAAKSAVKALVEGWDTNVLRALAAKPLSLTELDSLILGISYPSLERRLGAMRLAGLVEKVAPRTSRTPYAVTGWLRGAAAPLAAAIRWEQKHLSDLASPITRQDVEAGFLLAVPLLRLPSGLSGSCRMAVELRNGGGRGLAGVAVEVEDGRVKQCVARLEGRSEGWACGTASAWLAAVLDGDLHGLELGGDCHVVNELLDRLHARPARPAERAVSELAS